MGIHYSDGVPREVGPVIAPETVVNSVGHLGGIETSQQRTKWERRFGSPQAPASIDWGAVKELIIRRNLAQYGTAKLATDIQSPQQVAATSGQPINPATDLQERAPSAVTINKSGTIVLRTPPPSDISAQALKVYQSENVYAQKGRAEAQSQINSKTLFASSFYPKNERLLAILEEQGVYRRPTDFKQIFGARLPSREPSAGEVVKALREQNTSLAQVQRESLGSVGERVRFGEISPGKKGETINLAEHRKKAGIFSAFASPPIPSNATAFVLTIPPTKPKQELNFFGRLEEKTQPFFAATTGKAAKFFLSKAYEFTQPIKASKKAGFFERQAADLGTGVQIFGVAPLTAYGAELEDITAKPVTAGISFGAGLLAGPVIGLGGVALEKIGVRAAVRAVTTPGVRAALMKGTKIGLGTAAILIPSLEVAQAPVGRKAIVAKEILTVGVFPFFAGAGVSKAITEGFVARRAGDVREGRSPVEIGSSRENQLITRKPFTPEDITELRFKGKGQQVIGIKPGFPYREKVFKIQTKTAGKGFRIGEVTGTEFSIEGTVVETGKPLSSSKVLGKPVKFSGKGSFRGESVFEEAFGQQKVQLMLAKQKPFETLEFARIRSDVGGFKALSTSKVLPKSTGMFKPAILEEYGIQNIFGEPYGARFSKEFLVAKPSTIGFFRGKEFFRIFKPTVEVVEAPSGGLMAKPQEILGIKTFGKQFGARVFERISQQSPIEGVPKSSLRELKSVRKLFGKPGVSGASDISGGNGLLLQQQTLGKDVVSLPVSISLAKEFTAQAILSSGKSFMPLKQAAIVSVIRKPAFLQQPSRIALIKKSQPLFRNVPLLNSLAITGSKEKLAQVLKPVSKIEIASRPRTTFFQGVTQRSAIITIPKVAPIIDLIPGPVVKPVPPIFPGTSRVPGLLFDIGGSGSGEGRGRSQLRSKPSKYKPSLAAFYYGVQAAKAPKRITGLEIRPLVGKQSKLLKGFKRLFQ